MLINNKCATLSFRISWFLTALYWNEYDIHFSETHRVNDFNWVRRKMCGLMICALLWISLSVALTKCFRKSSQNERRWNQLLGKFHLFLGIFSTLLGTIFAFSFIWSHSLLFCIANYCRGFMTLRRSIVYRWIFFYWNGFFGNSTKLLNKLVFIVSRVGAFVFDAAETIASQSIWWASIRLGFFSVQFKQAIARNAFGTSSSETN